MFNKKIASELAVGVVIIIALVMGALFLMQQKKDVFLRENKTEAPVIEQAVIPAAKTAESIPSGQIPKNYNDESVVWYGSPKKVDDIKLFKDEEGLYQTWETGKIKTGEYAGSRLLLVVMDPQGPSTGAFIYRFIQKPGEEELQFLKNYSSNDIFSSFTLRAEDEEYGVLVKKTFPYKNYVYGLKIASLEYPGTIITPSGQQLKKEDDFPFAGLRGTDINEDEDKYFLGAFFQTDMLKFAFSDPLYGDFYTTDVSKINDSNSSTAYSANGFYVKAPDGTFRAYSAVMDLGGDVPKITWNNGTKNTSKYSYKAESGCGSANYINDVSKDISEDNLIQLGTADGTKIYGYKDSNDKALVDFYAEYKTLSNNGDLAPRYYPDENQKNLTYEQFLQTYPFFFVKDSFGRIIEFLNLHYIYSGGCGKPVIYLYPEQTENISIKVMPTAGITVSIPSYENGWNVSADPQSNIFNFADGKTYPYLFWEGSGEDVYHMPERGFVTEKDNLAALFDEKLLQLGLNQKEIFDFKEYWVPRMLKENKPYYFVTFVSRNEIDKLAPLEITPAPDTIIRVLMDYKGLDEKIDVSGFEIKTPRRNGFTAVEWGGVLR